MTSPRPSTQPRTLPLTRRLALVATLVLTTLMWGELVAGHQHLDGDSNYCELGSLPHAGSVGSTSEYTLSSLPGIHRPTFWNESFHPHFIPVYRGRAPPAFTS